MLDFLFILNIINSKLLGIEEHLECAQIKQFESPKFYCRLNQREVLSRKITWLWENRNKALTYSIIHLTSLLVCSGIEIFSYILCLYLSLSFKPLDLFDISDTIRFIDPIIAIYASFHSKASRSTNLWDPRIVLNNHGLIRFHT